MEKDASRVGYAIVRTHRQAFRGGKDDGMTKRLNRTGEKRELAESAGQLREKDSETRL